MGRQRTSTKHIPSGMQLAKRKKRAHGVRELKTIMKPDETIHDMTLNIFEHEKPSENPFRGLYLGHSQEASP